MVDRLAPWPARGDAGYCAALRAGLDDYLDTRKRMLLSIPALVAVTVFFGSVGTVAYGLLAGGIPTVVLGGFAVANEWLIRDTRRKLAESCGDAAPAGAEQPGERGRSRWGD